MSKIGLLVHTIKHMTPKQVIYRAKYEIKKKIIKKIKQIKSTSYNVDFVYYIQPAIDSESIQIADGILNDKFIFLNNLEHQFTNGIDWTLNPHHYRLWNFNLNYFDFLDILESSHAATSDPKYLKKGLALIGDWLSKHGETNDSNLWDPYVVSKRIKSWVLFYQYLIDCSYPIHDSEMFIQGLHTHLNYLKNNIEYYLGANHVIMDGKGLLFGGVFLNDSDAIIQGLQILREEFTEQILCDGGHYERSPSYQVEVLMHYLECGILLKRNNFTAEGNEIIDKAKPQVDYLFNLIMPNGEIPLVNDSFLDYPLEALSLLECASAVYSYPGYNKYNSNHRVSGYTYKLFGNNLRDKKTSAMSSIDIISVEKAIEGTGYVVIRDRVDSRELYFLFDCGDCGPDYNLGHAHADSLNIIMTFGNSKLLLDSGTYTYRQSYERDYYRSTAAHNTITIDSCSSSETWKAFRTAKRAKTKIIYHEECSDYIFIKARHDGYTKVLKNDRITHERSIIYIKKYGIIVVDRLIGEIKSPHTAEIRFLLNNDFVMESDNEYFEYDSGLLIHTDRPYRINDTKVSEVFNIDKKAKEICANITFSEEHCILTKFLFDRSNNLIFEKNVDGLTVECKQKKFFFKY